MRGKLYEAISRRNFLKGSGTAAVAAAALPAGMVRSLPAEAADPSDPFPHGLASGDPLTDRVMLWTRLNPDFVEATAQPGQAGVRGKPRCKGCKVESAPSTSTGKPGCKGCKVERDPSARARVQTAGLVWELVTFGEKVSPRNPLTMTNDEFDDGLIVASGSATAAAINDYTVKIDASGLVEGTYYYYRFSHGGVTSPIARTKTAPSNPDKIKMALVSCSSIPHGYFNAYGALAGFGANTAADANNFDDVDVVLCLGDYVYEYAQYCYPDGSAATAQASEPANEIVSLTDYRQRHKQYKSDPDLQALHRKFPMINVWDDHESADNSYPNGAYNHAPGPEGTGPTDPDADEDAWVAYHCNEPDSATETSRREGDWYKRVGASKRAYFEYLPIRPLGGSDPYRTYRTFNYGGLADLIMLDTRLLREGPGCPTLTENSAEGAEICDMFDQGGYNASEERYLLGKEQFDWLGQQLDGSTAKWQILGQQIMVGQLRVIPGDLLEPIPIPENTTIPQEGVIYITDLWDGWQKSRERLYREIENVNEPSGTVHAGLQDQRLSSRTEPGNVVILTGDIHTSWGNDIHPDPANPAGCVVESGYCSATGAGSLAVEYVCPSITSAGLPELDALGDCIRSVNPHNQYIDLASHGFMIVEIDADQVTGSWCNVGNIDASGGGEQNNTNYSVTKDKTLTSMEGEHHFVERGLPCVSV